MDPIQTMLAALNGAGVNSSYIAPSAQAAVQQITGRIPGYASVPGVPDWSVPQGGPPSPYMPQPAGGAAPPQSGAIAGPPDAAPAMPLAAPAPASVMSAPDAGVPPPPPPAMPVDPNSQGGSLGMYQGVGGNFNGVPQGAQTPDMYSALFGRGGAQQPPPAAGGWGAGGF